MNKWKIYIPDGVRDILVDDCFQKRNVEKEIRETFRHRGFQEIVTPTIEFFDSFSGQEDIISQESMVKFFDNEGRILVLKPDLTVPVARVAATKYKDRRPLKLFYIQNIFRDNKDRQFHLKEYTQAGCEIIGIGGPKADGELIAAAIEALKATGLKEFTVELGQVGYFKGLMEESGLKMEDRESLRQLVMKKDFLGLEKYVEALDLSQDLREAIVELPGLYGDISLLERIERHTLPCGAAAAIANLREVIAILDDYGLLDYIAIDMGMVTALHYYTGLTFQAFIPNLGFPLLGGGRYDRLVERFGVADVATGFSLNINLLLDVLTPMELDRNDIFIGYQANYRQDAIAMAEEFRRKGYRVELDLQGLTQEEAASYCHQMGIRELFYYEKPKRAVHAVFKKGRKDGWTI